jgi:hypothetical protein
MGTVGLPPSLSPARKAAGNGMRRRHGEEDDSEGDGGEKRLVENGWHRNELEADSPCSDTSYF